MEPPATEAKPPGDRTVSFSWDTDIRSAYVKGGRQVWQRFMQYGGRLHGSLTGGRKPNNAVNRNGRRHVLPVESLHRPPRDFNSLCRELRHPWRASFILATTISVSTVSNGFTRLTRGNTAVPGNCFANTSVRHYSKFTSTRDDSGTKIIGAYISRAPDDYGNFWIRYYLLAQNSVGFFLTYA